MRYQVTWVYFAIFHILQNFCIWFGIEIQFAILFARIRNRNDDKW